MNRFSARISSVRVVDRIALIDAVWEGQPMRIVTLQPPEGLVEEAEVTLLVHQTRPLIVRAPFGPIVAANLLAGRIKSVTHGELLSRVEVQTGSTTVTVLLDTPTLEAQGVEVGEEVRLAMRASDITIEVRR